VSILQGTNPITAGWSSR